MTPKKAPTWARTSARRVSYKQGAREVYVKPLNNTVAVRYREGAESLVYEALRSQGRVRAIEAQRLLITEFPNAARYTEAAKQLQLWEDEGVVEFVTPVLRDEESQLQQILTDEITVRFKAVLNTKQLQEVEEKYGVTIVRQNEFVPRQFVVKVPQTRGLRTLDVASQLDAADAVEFATPNFISEYRR